MRLVAIYFVFKSLRVHADEKRDKLKVFSVDQKC